MFKKKINYSAKIGDYQYFEAGYFLGPQILEKLISNKKAKLTRQSYSGSLLKSKKELLETLEASGARCVSENKINGCSVYLWENSSVGVWLSDKDKSITVDAWITDDECLKCISTIEKQFISQESRNLVYSIISSSNGPKAELVGSSGVPLIKDNYDPKVIEDYEYVVSEFKKALPAGRIILMEGSPGSGKSYIIRSLISEIDAIFLIVPSSLMSSLDGPNFLPVLLNLKKSNNKPIILIIEDGDAVIVSRGSDNLSSLATLLNLSDGIMGSMIDMRVIITTNAQIKNIDEAILRPGRLCKHMSVNEVVYNQANAIYHRLLKDKQKELKDLPSQQTYTLAQIYEISNDIDFDKKVIDVNGKKQIGFETPSNTARQAASVKEKIGF